MSGYESVSKAIRERAGRTALRGVLNGRSAGPDGRDRQWGADRQVDPMPAVPTEVGERTVAIGRLAVALTVAAWVAFVTITIVREVQAEGSGWPGIAQTVLFITLVSLLTSSAVAYMIARLGFYYRVRVHRRTPRASLDEVFSSSTPALTVLVPSFQEEARVIRMTLLSAALQEYPDLRVVLLIDDPPEPRYAGPHEMLSAARALPQEVEKLLSEPAKRFGEAYQRFSANRKDAKATPAEIFACAERYDEGVRWLGELADGYDIVDHADRFFRAHILGKLKSDLAVTCAALRGAAGDEEAHLSSERLEQLYRRLAWTFRAELSSFERKRYVSLSHEANKAMNLNSYIGLMGGDYREMSSPGGLALEPIEAPTGQLTDGARAEHPDLRVADCDYILTLDADSVVMPEYCLRLIHCLEQSQNAQVAVAQTPYSSYPGSNTRLERIAGATTDLQHIIHQGMMFYDAAFWVGANAVLRKRALQDIAQTEWVAGWPIVRYIPDRTVIEDTEASIDLVTRGWRLLNYPERLSYSATPPDFGSLCIQRRRWANGGLLIAPKLWRYARANSARGARTTLAELFMRLNYMASVFWSSIALLVLLAFRFNGHLLSPLVLAAAVPYFVTMTFDLRYCGYKYLDVLRIYAFNLLLLPVNLAGGCSSLVQGLTGAKGQFRRTPKVRSRTTPAFPYVVLPYLVVALSLYTFHRAYDHKLWGDALFAALNAVLAGYAIVAFMGVKNSLADCWVNILSWMYKSERPTGRASARREATIDFPADAPLRDWERVLYFGSSEQTHRSQPGESAPDTPLSVRLPSELDEALPLDHVRLSDERARLGADEGDARVPRIQRGARALAGRPDPVQHVLDP